jgi:hypothetical protein
MQDERKELLRRFYLTLELMCSRAGREADAHAQRIGNLYDDEDEAPGLWERGAAKPFLFAL